MLLFLAILPLEHSLEVTVFDIGCMIYMSMARGIKYAFLQESYAKYVKEYYLGKFGTSVETYNQEHLKNTTLTGFNSDRGSKYYKIEGKVFGEGLRFRLKIN